MKKTYTIQGMTCGNCVANVTKYLQEVPGVINVVVDLETDSVEIESDRSISVEKMKKVLPAKYEISESVNIFETSNEAVAVESKWKQLRPLFLIFFYLVVATALLNRTDFNLSEAMLDFMGIFFLVFSFFKFLDLKGFAESFRMYDPFAAKVALYGKMYPFLEFALGAMFLGRFYTEIALIATIVILGVTTIGVTAALLSKKKIKCACLGTVLNLPMTEATFIENAIMIVMAFAIVFNLV